MTQFQGDTDQKILHDFIAKMLDGSMTETEHRQLQDRLRDDPDARQAYFHFIDLDTDLREILIDGDDRQRPSRFDLVRSGRSRLWGWSKLIALAAALLLMGSLLSWGLRNRDQVSVAINPPRQFQAVLVQSAGGEFFRDAMPPIGQSLQSNHEYALTLGMIELRFPSGAEVILEAPTVIEILRSDRLLVKQGRCSVHAPPGAEGFQVITPQTEVTDLGTRFSVAVDEGGDTDVQVIEGAAEVRRRDRSEAILLTHSQASRVAGGQFIHSAAIAFRPDQYQQHLPDRVLSFRVGNQEGENCGRLLGVSVQRDDREIVYDRSELIDVEVTHFRGGENTHHLSVAVGDPVPEGDDRWRVLADDFLHTGLINLGGSEQALNRSPILEPEVSVESTPGMAVRFQTPVVNGPGPDVVFFELQAAVNPKEGDAFHVSPLEFESGLRSLTIRRYDLTLNSAEAMPIPPFDLLEFGTPIHSLDQLVSGKFERRNPAISFWAIAVGIDLSDLGYPSGMTVGGLFFQDATDQSAHSVDPVFIAGLPIRPFADRGTASP